MIIRSMSPPKGLAEPRYFFDAGIRFECQRCGACCTGEPGTIYAAGDEIESIAEYLDISAGELKTRYGYPYRDSVSFREEADGRCCFYENGCRIYPVRPRQCRTYPFWFDIMRSEKRWRKAACECPGIGKGRLHTREEILARIKASYPKEDMPRKRTIIDASSAILLVKTGLFRCLTDAYQVVMAEAVYTEVSPDGYPGAQRFAEAREKGQILVLASRPETTPGGKDILTGSGERETIRLFSQGEGDFVIIDDRKGAALCRDTGIPYINALLFPRILMFAGGLSESDCRKQTSQLLALGRYSKQIASVAAGATRERLSRFLPS